MMHHPDMDILLRDSYANYVIQTCLESAQEDQRLEFIECIRPLMTSIRNTPHGKRIYNKIQREDQQKSASCRVILNN
jgi:hypothetical protein